MAFSPDGTLFATCGRNDRLVKIWYENKQVLFPAKGSSGAGPTSSGRHGGDDVTGSIPWRHLSSLWGNSETGAGLLGIVSILCL